MCQFDLCKWFTFISLSATLGLVIENGFSESMQRTLYAGSMYDKVDIDIGTHGKAMNSEASKLITFDPFDKKIILSNYERYPYAIADFSGNALFSINKQFSPCSSINLRNSNFSETHLINTTPKNCTSRFSSITRKCLRSRTETKMVKAITLSSFLKWKRIRHIQVLKIDSQGSDFDILKDIFENCPFLTIDTLKFECQTYDKSVPLYFTTNDCDLMEQYVKEKYKNVLSSRTLINCGHGEYDILFRHLLSRHSPSIEGGL